MSEKFHPGITIQSVVLGSDATHLTNFSGDKSIHAVYMTLPKPKFANTKFDATGTLGEANGMPSLCGKIFLHEALRHILARLHIGAHDGRIRASEEVQRPRIRLDAGGHHRLVISVLMSWSVDLLEHQDLLGLGTYSGVKCMARYKELDLAEDGVPPCQPRDSAGIIETLRMIRAEHPNATTWQFKNLAKEYGLSGVEHPFWEGLPLDTVRVISLDLLHGGYKSFQDHQIPMISELVGASQLDDRLIAQPARTGVRTFVKGIWGGRGRWFRQGCRESDRCKDPVLIHGTLPSPLGCDTSAHGDTSECI